MKEKYSNLLIYTSGGKLSSAIPACTNRIARLRKGDFRWRFRSVSSSVGENPLQHAACRDLKEKPKLGEQRATRTI